MSLVEITTFRLVTDADEVAFLRSDRRVQTELIPNQPGFMRRTTAREGAQWLVLTLWASEADALAYADAAVGHTVQVEFERHLDLDSLVTSRYVTLD